MLEALGLKHALIVLGEGEETFFRAARNLAAHKVLLVAGLNVYDVLNYDEVLMSEPVARAIEARLTGDGAMSGRESDSLAAHHREGHGGQRGRQSGRVPGAAARRARMRFATWSSACSRSACSRCARSGCWARSAAADGSSGARSDWKKAYVTLKEGDRIEFFEGV